MSKVRKNIFILVAFIVAALLSSPILCLGDVGVWEKTFGGTSEDYGNSVQETSDGGYIIAGHTYSFGAGGGDVYLVKTDSSGNLVWEKTFGGANWDVGYSVQVTGDGDYIIAGRTYSFGAGGLDVYLVKVDGARQRVT